MTSSKLKDRFENIEGNGDLKSLFLSVNRFPHTIKGKTILFNEGDPLERLYFIVEGFVKLYRLSDEGRQTTTYACGPGDILGLRSLISKEKCTKHNAETITAVKVISISHQEFFNTCMNKPEYLVDLLHLYLNRLIYTETRLEAFITTDALTRVAIFLNYFSDKFGKVNGKEIILPINLTHQLIAEFIGSVRETVSVTLKHLADEKVLRVHKSKIVILDPEKLKEYLV